MLVRVAGDDRIATRLRAELRSHAWRVIELNPRGDQPQSLDTLAANRGATAALRARPRQLAVELWVAPQPGSDGAGSDELIVATGVSADAGVLALRVSEALRARGLGPATIQTEHSDSDAKRAGASAAPNVRETSQTAPTSAETSAPGETSTREGVADGNAAAGTEPAAEHAAAAAPAPSAAEPATKSDETRPAADSGTPTPAAEPGAGNDAAGADQSQPDDDGQRETESDASQATGMSMYLELAPAFGWSPGGFPPRGDAWVNLRLQPTAAVSFSAFALAPVLQGRVSSERDAGSASVRTVIAGISADAQLATHAWQWSAGLGIAGLMTLVRNVLADPMYSTRPDTLLNPAAIARLAAVWRVTGSVHLVGRVLVGVSKLVIVFPHGEKKNWGLPFVSFALGLEFTLPWAH